MRTQIRDRYELDDNYVSDSTLNAWINGSYQDLYDLMLAANTDWFTTTDTSITVSSGTSAYSLPADFYKLVGVDVADGSDWYNLRPFNLAERNRYTNGDKSFARYRIMNGQIHIYPTPAWGAGLRLWYVPVPTALSGDGDTLDGVNGWEEYVIVDVMIKAAQKEEQDATLLVAQKEALIKRIQKLAQHVDDGEAPRVRDTQAERRYIPWRGE